MTSQRRRNRVAKALRWQERDGSVFWNGRRFLPTSQAPLTSAPIKGHHRKAIEIQRLDFS